MSKVDRSVVGLIFGNALTNVTNLFANGVFEFEDPGDAQGSVDEIVEITKLLTLASIDGQVEVADEVGAEDERPTKGSSRPSGRSGSSSGRSSTSRTSGRGSDRPAGVKRENRNKPATDNQIKALEKMGWDGDWDLTMQEASDAIQSLQD